MEEVEAQFQNGNEGEGHLGLYRRKAGPSPITVRNGRLPPETGIVSVIAIFRQLPAECNNRCNLFHMQFVSH
jgi:hypothetical protein